MKNIFYFDKDYEMTLLLNEQCENNCIFFNIQTDETANQYLDVVCNTQTTSQLLESNTLNVFELTGDRWATSGCTTFRLRNDTKTTEWYNIDFPETMSTDMCLCETSEYHYAAQCQSSEFDVNEIKSSTLVYTNTRDYRIETTPVKIATIQYTVLQDVNATFTATILLKAYGIIDKAKVKIKLQINKIYDTVFIPTQDISNGEHIITINYPLIHPAVYDTNTVNVYMEIDSGYVTIEQEKIKATLTAAGLMTDIKWDGTIEIEEEFTDINLGGPTLKEMTENVLAVNVPPATKGITQNMNKISLGGLNVASMTDFISFEHSIDSYHLDVTKADKYTYDSKYVLTDNKYELRTEYICPGTDETIDSGRLQSITIDKSNFISMTAIDYDQV